MGNKKVVYVLLPNNKRIRLNKIAKKLDISYEEAEESAWQLQKQGKVLVETRWNEKI